MSLLIRTDVSAVKLYNGFILAGIGSSLHVFNKTLRNLLQKLPCLKGQKIYGFVPLQSSNKIIIFGGKQFVVAEKSDLEDSNNVLKLLFKPEVTEDWLHSAVWVNNDTVALLTAHNIVQVWDVTKPCLRSQYESRENSILYSGLLLPLQDDVLVFAGTVFSEVIIHACSLGKSLHYLKGHRGVIFSISCDPQKGIVITTSDDRSVRIWGINYSESDAANSRNTLQFWQKADIVCKHEVYGHTARVMRNCITNNMVVSVGEDSIICFWDFNGKLLKKNVSHQNAGIWSVDADNEHLVTGGGDSGVILHPLTLAIQTGEHNVLNVGATPKKIVFTARRNIVVLNDNDDIIHYNVEHKTTSTIKLTRDSTYKILNISSCKQMIAVADMTGNLNVFIENCKEEAALYTIIKTKLDIGKILSMQWAGNRHIVLCSEKGLITVLASKQVGTEFYEDFELPTCKERWLTASAIDETYTKLIVGDRCGNIHVYVKGTKNPIKSFSKVHGRYGPTSITIKCNDFVTTGRDGTIKYFEMSSREKSLAKYLNSKNLEFQWVEKFIDKNETIVCGFQERIFVVYDVKNCSKLVEVPCGGGHRSWDVARYFEKRDKKFEEYIRFMFVKNADIRIQTFELSKIVSTNIVNGSHCKEINCLTTYRSALDMAVTFCFSGGEDTTTRISSVNSQMEFQDVIVFKHLSTVKTLKMLNLESNEVLLVTAGGRAQICLKLLQFSKLNDKITVKSVDLVDYLIKGTEKERKGKQTWRNCSIDFDPETRIMDVCLRKVDDDNFTLFAGCSDAHLRVFHFDLKTNNLKLIKELKHHKTCILRTHYVIFFNQDLLVTCTTRGEVTFWNIKTVTNELAMDLVLTTVTNKSGINCLDTRVISKNQLLFATGGDDNAIHLNVLEVSDISNMGTAVVSHQWSSDKLHCSQISGILLLENVLISTSIDQRVTLCRWAVDDEGIKCEFLTQIFSDVADIQGIDLIESSSDYVTVCVFGKGIELIKIPTISY